MAEKKTKTNLQLEVVALVEKGKYPKKDGGVLTLSGDSGDIVATNNKGVLAFDYIDHSTIITFTLDTGKLKVNKYGGTPAAAPVVQEKKKATAKAKAEPPEKKEKPEPLEPRWVEHMASNGIPEQVDFNIYCNIVQCDCGNIRYIKNSDVHQVKECKPCARRRRRRSRRESKRSRGSTDPGLAFGPRKQVEEKSRKEQAKGKVEPAAPAKAKVAKKK